VELWQDGVRMDVVFMLLIVIGGAANLTAFLLNMHLQGVAVKPVVFCSIIVGIALVDMYSTAVTFTLLAKFLRGFQFATSSRGQQFLLGRHNMVQLKRCYLYYRIVLAGVKHNEHYDLVLLNLSGYSSEVSSVKIRLQKRSNVIISLGVCNQIKLYQELEID
jgi:hypothetical protein